MRYVDGFLIVIEKDELEDNRELAEQGRDIWMKYGALDYKECIGEDLNPDMGGMEARS